MSTPTPRKVQYPQPLSEYARTYGRSLRSMKAWVAHGKRAGQLPPLQSPAEMPDWYAKNVAERVPDDLLAV